MDCGRIVIDPQGNVVQYQAVENKNDYTKLNEYCCSKSVILRSRDVAREAYQAVFYLHTIAKILNKQYKLR